MPPSLSAAFDRGRVLPHYTLAPLTTFRIGGPADWFVDLFTAGDVVQAVRAASEDGIRVTVMGGGSNLLVGDRGVRGLVVRPRAAGIERLAPHLVRADAGATINGLVRWTVREGLGGLAEWAGTPGSVGGALCGNAHWAGRLIGELVREVGVVTRDGRVDVRTAAEMAFAYDASRLQSSGEIALWATFGLAPGQQPGTLRAAARASLEHRKATQPLRMPSAGCVFQNPVPGRDVVPDGMPWSAGALIDRAGLKGHAVGAARVSPVHANFVVNEGGATAADVRALIDMCRRAVHEQFGVWLREEIVYVGEF
jgi:UDP-N-acetylmuramate dehydrogenase